MKKSIFIIMGFLVLSACGGSSPRPKENVTTSSVYELFALDVRGTKQWVSIRSRDTSLPLLVILHGGPGFSEMALVRHFLPDLEHEFTVVNYDQRGAGKSIGSSSDAHLTMEDYIEDSAVVIDYCLNRFKKERVYLLGHSWGSFLGIHVAQRYPEKIIAYIGTGQMSNVPEAELISYREALRRAREEKHAKAVRELIQIGEPVNGMYPGGHKTVEIERKWLAKFGGSYSEGVLEEAYLTVLLAPEYSLNDKYHMLMDETMLSAELEKYVHGSNLETLFPSFEVPVFFLLGRNDYHVPSVAAARYYELLNSPLKRLYWFESSGHAPPFEEPERFVSVMHEIRKMTDSSR